MFVYKIKHIIIGWYRFLFGKRTAQANSRMSICNDCELRKGYFCGVCWCELHAKTSLEEEKCPHPKMNKWIYIDNYYKTHPLKTEIIETRSDL